MAKTLRMYRFTFPRSQILTMIGILALFAVLVSILLPRILPVFSSSPYLNLGIICVFFIGIVSCFWQVWQVYRSVTWINAFSIGNPHKLRGTPRLLAPLAVLMKGNQLPTGMSTASAQSILDSVSTRLDETREVTKYLVNLLIFLGLLGTFYGLATTIPAVVDTIRSATLDTSGDADQGFNNLMKGLEGQLGGIGTAFGSSLIGLAGSLLVGMIELFAGHSQNQFYREFEEWVSHFTTVGLAETGSDILATPGDNNQLVQAFMRLNECLLSLDERLADQNEASKHIVNAFKVLTEGMETSQNLTGDVRNALRSLDTNLISMNESLAVGRDQSTLELKREISAVNATLREAIRDADSKNGD